MTVDCVHENELESLSRVVLMLLLEQLYKIKKFYSAYF